jgi:hypothetical protein
MQMLFALEIRAVNSQKSAKDELVLRRALTALTHHWIEGAHMSGHSQDRQSARIS